MMRYLLVSLTCAGLLLAQRPPTEQAWDLLAQGRRADAVRVLRQVINENSKDAEAHLMLGSILSEDGKYAEAMEELEAAVRLLPRSALAHNALGEALYASGTPKAASAEFGEAIELDPKFAPARVSLALILLEAGEFAPAGEHLKAALEVTGESVDSAFARYLLAKVYAERNEIEQAAEELREAVTLQPDFAEAWSDLGETRKTLLDHAGAFQAFQQAVKADPANSVAQYRLGSEYLHRGEVSRAVTHLERAYELDPKNQSTLYNLQLALRQSGQNERADIIKQRLREFIRERDRVSQRAMAALGLNNEGVLMEKEGKLTEALERYREATALDPDHVGIRTNFAVALLRLGQWTEGLEQLREALRRDPENVKLKQAWKDALSQAPPGAAARGSDPR